MHLKTPAGGGRVCACVGSRALGRQAALAEIPATAATAATVMGSGGGERWARGRRGGLETEQGWLEPFGPGCVSSRRRPLGAWFKCPGAPCSA